MKFAQMIVAALAFSLAEGVAFCRPPDEIPHSPIPPLKARAARVVGPGNPFPIAAPSAPAKERNVANDYEDRLAIWNSPEMVEARLYVLDYSERSARSSRKEGEQFLARLSQLSPAEMMAWLERLQAARAGMARQQDVEWAARQMMLEQSARRLEAARQAYANINQWQSQGAQYAHERFQSQQLFSQQQMNIREAGRFDVAAAQRTYFDPVWPIFDPASPRGDARYWAAAASLPGDLPRSDPRNFIRGEEGIDTGEREFAGDRVAAPVAAPPAEPVVEVASAPTSGE